MVDNKKLRYGSSLKKAALRLLFSEKVFLWV
jgi:hypothetical protein